ncbi:MAG TPA: hypothetical protein VGE41_14005 [Verrucomicrobiae bacterium]
MNTKWLFVAALAGAALVTGCETTPLPPNVERGPNGTIAYDVLVEASAPGARIEANGEYVGNTPVHIKIFGDRDGTFHDFGSYYYVVQAQPLTTNQFQQTRVFQTGHLMSPEDRIPQRIYFEMNQYQPPAPNYAYPPPGPYYYGPPPPYYYGPTFRFYYGPHYYHRRW